VLGAVVDLWSSRPRFGGYEALLKIILTDSEAYLDFCRMKTADYQELFILVSPYITHQYTRFRRAISADVQRRRLFTKLSTPLFRQQLCCLIVRHCRRKWQQRRSNSRLCSIRQVASTLLLVWTRLNCAISWTVSNLKITLVLHLYVGGWWSGRRIVLESNRLLSWDIAAGISTGNAELYSSVSKNISKARIRSHNALWSANLFSVNI